MANDNCTTLWTIPPEKFCPKCKRHLPLESFGNIKGKPRSYCRTCHKAYMNEPDARSEKTCPSCKQVKPMGEFSRLGKRHQSRCRECQNTTLAEIRAKHKESGRNVEINRQDYLKRRRKVKLKVKYGLSIERYDEMFLVQNGLCAICLEPEKEIDKQQGTPLSLSVDHDHKTGKTRGLLCRRCNIGIGRLKESVDNLQRAIEYLKKYS